MRGSRKRFYECAGTRPMRIVLAYAAGKTRLIKEAESG